MADESLGPRDESEPRGRGSAIPPSTPMSDDAAPLLALPSDEAHLWCKCCADTLLEKARTILPGGRHDTHVVYATDATGEETCSHCMA